MSSKASTSAPQATDPADLRNVVLIGSSGSGKTTLFENLIRTRVPGYRGEKDDPERAAALTLATITNGSTVINLLDAPGNPDFVGELRAGLRAADAAVFVISAADGIDITTRLLWAECAGVGTPRAIVVTKLDTERASFEATVQECQQAFGEGVHPAYMPFVDDDGQIVGSLSLLSRKVHDYSSGRRVARVASDAETEAIDGFRTEYLESIITESEDDDLLERYFDGDELAVDEVVQDLMKALYLGRFYPVIPVLTSGVGTEELIGVIDRGFPTPLRWKPPLVTTPADDPVDVPDVQADGPLIAEVIRTTSDPYAGRLSMVRVFNGTLRPDASVHLSGRRGRQVDDTERVGLLSAPAGIDLASKDKAIAGEIVMVAKLTTAETADTLSDASSPVVVEPWPLPEPLLPTAIRAATRGDEDKLAGALQRLLVEDPTVRIERASGTDQLLLWTTGQSHQDLLMTRLKERYGVNIQVDQIHTPLRETFVAPASAHGRHVKQSGGHGQYAVCDIRIEPNVRGAGFEFIDKVVGGAVPRQFIPSVEKGVRTQMERGTITGYPMVDIKVTLYDGKAHSVDSSDMAFQAAGALALKEAASASTVALLEPLDEIGVEVADEYLGAVMTDLGNRRGQVQGTDSVGEGRSVVRALVPQSELCRYAIDLRGIARGTGTFTRCFHGYELMPANVAQEHLKG
ncbi:elongation factor G-like protein EF-G2 [Brooklawnia cerclae]|uniref:Elongation factor G n=1 Tax=Brooklawnia cerclae TaxID=349934 RepID=A0ABX0SBW5_9ACTN|nr:elongation factor G-like protein EF-G2 [Brooklawnia cerclae]NIH55872.1 elongation factor G [Brooklawnia cerclae]